MFCSVYYVLGSVLEAEDTEINKQTKISALEQIHTHGEWTCGHSRGRKWNELIEQRRHIYTGVVFVVYSLSRA